MAEPKKRKVNRSVHVATTPDKAMAAFLDPEKLKGWWGVTRAIVEERRGGVWALRWDQGGMLKYVTTGVIKSIKPGERIRIESLVNFGDEFPIIGPMRLFVSAKAEEGGARVSVRQDGYGEGPEWDRYYEAVIKGWKDALKMLKSYLETGTGTVSGQEPPDSAT
jgi:uncharacterized protein YndB with AHSA1/START domain